MSQERLHTWKVKLEIRQPDLMCSGRSKVTFKTRGIATYGYLYQVTKLSLRIILVQFKSKGILTTVTFRDNMCITRNWEDLKIAEE